MTDACHTTALAASLRWWVADAAAEPIPHRQELRTEAMLDAPDAARQQQGKQRRAVVPRPMRQDTPVDPNKVSMVKNKTAPRISAGHLGIEGSAASRS
jgi:hypothetical protein